MSARLDIAEPQRIPRISRTLRLIAAGMLALIIGAVIHRLVVQRGIIIESARTNLYRLDILFVEQTGRAVEAVDLVLRDVAEQQSRPPEARPNYRMPLSERLGRRIEGFGQITQIEVLDQDGKLVASAPPFHTPVPDALVAARQEMVQRLRRGGGDGVQFGLPFQVAGDIWSVLMARRYDGPNGTFGGVVVACLNLPFFEDFYRSVDLPDDGMVILQRRDGIVLAASPRREGLIGSNTIDHPPFRVLLAGGIEGSGIINRVSDDAERIVAIRAHKTLPLVITVSISLDSALREWQRRGIMLLSGGIPLAALVWALLSYGARQTRQIEVLLAENRQARDAAIEANINLRAQIDERERTEAALQQAQRLEAIGQLTGGVAHDFNNLLTVLLGNIDLMQARVPGDRRSPDPAITARLERMRAAAEKGATLTDQLLAFARRQPLHPKAASLNGVITGMTDLLQSAIGSNIRFDPHLGEAVWAVLVDTTQIELVILNLALNARDAMPKGGTLTLRTENVTIAGGDATIDLPAGDYVAVRVIDNGTGMTEAVQARAFEPFFTTKSPGMGSGLGLSQVYGVARQSGGSARIESRLGAGTTVTVYLPRTDTDLSTPADQDGESGMAISRGARILLVDDDADVRATTVLILEAIGYTVIPASSGAHALTLLDADEAFDLLITDVVMPDINGAELASETRSRRPAMPIIFVSGYADPAALAGRKNLQPLLRKPFRATDLAQVIEVSLSDARKIASLRTQA